MEREKSWEVITNIGNVITKNWMQLSRDHRLNISISGLSSMTGFSICSNNWLKYKTLITQEMLKKNILASNLVYVCIEHKHEIINNYFENLDPIFTLIKKCEDGSSIDEMLGTGVCHSGFKRLN